MLMYFDMQKQMFEGTTKFCVAADPSSYAGEKTLVSIVWSRAETLHHIIAPQPAFDCALWVGGLGI